MSNNRATEGAGNSLPPPEIPSLQRPDGTSPKSALDPHPGASPAGLPPPEIKPLTAPTPVQPLSSKRSGCGIALLVFAVLVVVTAFLIYWFVLRPAL